jgi:lipopolysaccharide biosynthesis glycosyltransferase
MKIFIGYDSREPIAFHVLAHSIMRRASKPVEIVPLIQSQLRQCGLYTRDKDPRESTEFSLTRFLVPTLSHHEGVSVYLDGDMLCLCDITTLESKYPLYPVSVVQHHYEPSTAWKFLGNQQLVYPMKNWSSLMVFQNSLCMDLTAKYVNTAEPLDLHRFAWSDLVGSLPTPYNWLVGEYPKINHPEILHFTLGGPWFPDYANCDYADLWREEARHAGLLNG